jgi:hypothetical protein
VHVDSTYYHFVLKKKIIFLSVKGILVFLNNSLIIKGRVVFILFYNHNKIIKLPFMEKTFTIGEFSKYSKILTLPFKAKKKTFVKNLFILAFYYYQVNQ